MRVCVLILLVLSLGCATLDTFIIDTPRSGDRSAAAQDRAAAVRETLASFGLRQVPSPKHGEEWLDPEPPDLRVTMFVRRGYVELELHQKHDAQCYEPPKLKELENALLQNINERFGKGTMRYEYPDYDGLP
jgi:hypothetical protein